ncbi:DUF4396 domain-containing protein [bacterium]|nr:DUF4396 domain-containing protein [bacterium]|tara:strand:+ start:2001 stop:2417 length:417 start_codon:yes stop_codon:yes gene_type:complete
MWKCKHTWKKASVNTLWCLFGCSIGDFGTIIYFQNITHGYSTLEIMLLAIVNGLITSIILETVILWRQLEFLDAFKTAIGMSFVSMVGMEIAMNTTDFMLNGEAIINLRSLPYILIAGFCAPVPYNYWKLKKYGISCH